ncbi:Mg2+ transporter MgtE [Halanaerobium saccharolyticum]|uniref:Magnesium transporter MgtE n=1 Tax=Halanaerobium saccharolyticum TaxID=43595 RepID=A0A4R7Z7S6_9FIRM|nr:magnesium transporter [Halanaerobium saccharolyticum]RAK11803.1 Mg2+ transporter MgtE [Halanaerobium saccharolyticum]TDW07644.1 Mg2+ transporter MgtE [Halanaerobium saccharolyticum]TDX64565.1 Mg2+ transporter MgtE [Halanaerobium saccharolyticum]
MLLDKEYLQRNLEKTRSALEKKNLKEAVIHSKNLPVLRLTRLLKNFSTKIVFEYLEMLDTNYVLKILINFPEEYSAELLIMMEENKMIDLIALMKVDDAVDILKHLEKEKRKLVLSALNEEQRKEINDLISYSEEMIGSYAENDFLYFKKGKLIEEIISEIKNSSKSIEHKDYIYIVNDEIELKGVVSFRDLLFNDRKTVVDEIMKKEVFAAKMSDSALESAQRLKSRRLKQLPILDDRNILVGILSMEKAVEILSDELTDGFLEFSGVRGEESFFTHPKESIKLRLPWMAFNIFLNLGAVAVISSFEATIAQVAILAAFLPMITDMGGNVGIQALSVSIRSLALGEVQIGDFFRAFKKEIKIGIFNGIVLGAIFGAVAYFLQKNILLSIVAGTALAVNVLVAGVVGGTMPFFIKKLGKDPALMTGPFLTTITDITGVSIYLGLSTLLILQIIA